MGSTSTLKRQGGGRVLNVDATMSPLTTVMTRPVEWLWPGRIVVGNLTLVIGDPDVGKSLLAMDLAARLPRGGEWPDGQRNAKPGGVVLLSAEDHLHYSVRPALERAGANLARISSLLDVRVQRESETSTRPFELKRDLEVLGKAIRSVEDCKLVVIDPLAAFLGRGTNPRGTLNELMKLASCEHVAVLGITHLKPGGRHALYRTMGAFDLTTAARAVWLVAEDKSEVGMRNAERKCAGGRRLVLPVKNNLAGESTGMAFTLVKEAGACAPRVQWLEMDVETTADEALASRRSRTGPEAEQRSDAIEFLKQALADGPRLVKDVEAEGRQARFIRARTLERARKELRVKAFRKSVPGPWWVQLPGDGGVGRPVPSGAPKIAGDLGDLGGVGVKAGEIEVMQDRPRPPGGGVGSEVGSGNEEGLKNEVQMQSTRWRVGLG